MRFEKVILNDMKENGEQYEFGNSPGNFIFNGVGYDYSPGFASVNNDVIDAMPISYIPPIPNSSPSFYPMQDELFQSQFTAAPTVNMGKMKTPLKEPGPFTDVDFEAYYPDYDHKSKYTAVGLDELNNSMKKTEASSVGVTIKDNNVKQSTSCANHPSVGSNNNNMKTKVDQPKASVGVSNKDSNAKYSNSGRKNDTFAGFDFDLNKKLKAPFKQPRFFIDVDLESSDSPNCDYQRKYTTVGCNDSNNNIKTKVEQPKASANKDKNASFGTQKYNTSWQKYQSSGSDGKNKMKAPLKQPQSYIDVDLESTYNPVDELLRSKKREKIEIIEAVPISYRLPVPDAKVINVGSAKKGKAPMVQPEAKVNPNPYAAYSRQHQFPTVQKFSGGFKIYDLEDLDEQTPEVVNRQKSGFDFGKPYNSASNVENPSVSAFFNDKVFQGHHPSASAFDRTDFENAKVHQERHLPVPNASSADNSKVKSGKKRGSAEKCYYTPRRKNQTAEQKLEELEKVEMLKDYLFEARCRTNGKFDYFYHHGEYCVKFRSMVEVDHFNSKGVSNNSEKPIQKRSGANPIFQDAAYISPSGRSVITYAKFKRSGATRARAATATAFNNVAEPMLAIVPYDPKIAAAAAAHPKNGGREVLRILSAADHLKLTEAEESGGNGGSKRKADEEISPEGERIKRCKIEDLPEDEDDEDDDDDPMESAKPFNDDGLLYDVPIMYQF